jgi:hypothetical protein
MKKIIFLDIDGVLNDHAFDGDAGSSTILPGCVQRLNEILRKTEACIVLTSAWRYMILQKAMTVVGFDHLLRTHGVIKERLIGNTCADEVIKERHDQIRNWLAIHEGEIGEWIAIDDLKLELDEDGWRFLHIDGFGITDEHVEIAIALLNGNVRDKKAAAKMTTKVAQKTAARNTRRFRQIDDYDSSTRICPCGAQITWSGFSDKLDDWVTLHEGHAGSTAVEFTISADGQRAYGAGK